ncbi:hypothetical protein GCM10011331_10080 [Flavimobilis marinus]|nr:hypothetical protein GCM10011331_10080 [Flavimobilis marinus]
MFSAQPGVRARVMASAAAALLGLVATTGVVAPPALAAEAVPERLLTLDISKNIERSFRAGDEVTFTYTATNNNDFAIQAAPNEAVEIHFSPDREGPRGDGFGFAVGGDCVEMGLSPDSYTFQSTAPLPTTFEPGGMLECSLTYTTTAGDVARGGIWTAITHYPGDSQDHDRWWWDYSTFMTYEAEGGSDLPTISGTPLVGQTLTADSWWWHPYDAPHAHQWLRDGVPIPGATSATYLVTQADVGARLALRTEASGIGMAFDSVSTAVVQAPGLTAAVPRVVGDAQVGSTLTVTPGGWDPPGVTFAYQWLRDGTVIRGATAVRYTIVPQDVARRISVRVTGSHANGASAVAVSGVTAPVRAGVIVTSSSARISGAARVGRKLTAVSPKVVTPGVTTAYQWLRNGKKITGATKKTYTLKAADKSKKIAVAVTVRKPGFASVTSRSSATPKIKAGKIAVRQRAKVKGAPRVGKKLTAVVPKVGVTRAKYSYQWLRDGKKIKGATKKKYKISSRDRGDKISVKVTVKKPGYAAVTSSSARTKAVRGR